MIALSSHSYQATINWVKKCKTNLASAKALLKPDNNNGASEESPSRKHYSKVNSTGCTHALLTAEDL